MSKTRKIAVLGAGAWGTALAIHLSRVGHEVVLWSHNLEQANQMSQERQNRRFLPDVSFPSTLTVFDSFEGAVTSVAAILIVVPSHAFSETVRHIKSVLPDSSVPIAWATKGFEPESQKLLHEVAFDVLGEHANLTVLSGPTFANEVAVGLPTAMVSASNNTEQAGFWADLFGSERFRMYTQADMAGVEVGGAYKNIMAIATGVSDGLKMGANARAALISRGMAEMMRLSEVMGGQSETMMGLAGLGDLVLTCTDDLSRNRRFGFGLAQGTLSTADVMQDIGQVVEGVKAVYAVKRLADRMSIELPIMEQVYLLVNDQTTPRQAVQALMSRSAKAE